MYKFRITELQISQQESNQFVCSNRRLQQGSISFWKLRSFPSAARAKNTTRVHPHELQLWEISVVNVSVKSAVNFWACCFEDENQRLILNLFNHIGMHSHEYFKLHEFIST